VVRTVSPEHRVRYAETDNPPLLNGTSLWPNIGTHNKNPAVKAACSR